MLIPQVRVRTVQYRLNKICNLPPDSIVLVAAAPQLQPSGTSVLFNPAPTELEHPGEIVEGVGTILEVEGKGIPPPAAESAPVHPDPEVEDKHNELHDGKSL